MKLRIREPNLNYQDSLHKNCFAIRLSFAWNHYLDVKYEEIILDNDKFSVDNLYAHVVAIDSLAAILNSANADLSNKSLTILSDYAIYDGIRIPIKRLVQHNKFNALCQELCIGEIQIIQILCYDTFGKRYDISFDNFSWVNPKQRKQK